MRKLLVVSDAAVYVNNNEAYGFGPVVRELEMLQHMFDEVVWMGCAEKTQLYADTLVENKKIKIVSLPSVKHKRFNAFFVMLAYPAFLLQLVRQIKTATHIHTRGPAHPALLAVLYSFLDSRRYYWHKYAGDWHRSDAPFTYRLQRSLLKSLTKSNKKITVNSISNSTNANIISFENPAVYQAELNNAVDKSFNKQLDILFVGNLTVSKGILTLLEVAGKKLTGIGNIFVAGDGVLKTEVDQASLEYEHIMPLGHLTRNELIQLYNKCHLLVLPSLSEGFPKVLIEAATFSCIPVVSATSVIAHYLHEGENGFLLHDLTATGIATKLNAIIALPAEELKTISKNARLNAGLFTYERFKQRVEKEIFSN